MQTASGQRDLESPEKLISGLVARLRKHAFWDSLLLCLPPLLALTYVGNYLYRAAFISEISFAFLSVVAVGIFLAAASILHRPLVPSGRSAAGLLDARADTKDRFVTLATVDPAACLPLFFSRLRQEAAGFLNRIEIQREFPYKIKPSFYKSLVISGLAAILLHLLLPIVQSGITPVPVHERIQRLARQMAQRPRLAELARGLQTLVNKLEDPKVSLQEQQAVVQEMQKKVDEQQKKEQQKEERDLLGQASSALKGLDQQSGAGQDQPKDQNKAGGNIQSNLPQEGQGEGKQSQGAGGDNKGELNAQLDKGMQQGKSAQGETKGQTGERNQQSKGEDKSQQGDPNKPDGDKSKETAGKREGKSEQPGGKGKASEETPKGAPPSERLYPGNQAKDGIKNARYVTVQLPEEAAVDSKGKTTAGNESNGSRNRTKVPLSNVPLPAHVPDAPTEVQQMPLEYRGMIR
jgi:hypothetical protein